MKHRLVITLFSLIIANLSLVLITVIMNVNTHQDHPMAGRLISVDGVNIHLKDNLHGQSAQSAQTTQAARHTKTQSVINTAENQDKRSAQIEAQAPTLVFLHGNGANLLDFERSLVQLANPSFRVISVDRPGHGYSERGKPVSNVTSDTIHNVDEPWVDPAAQAQYIADALEQIGVEKSIWIGHSWASAVVLAALVSNDNRVDAGILVAGVTHATDKNAAWYKEIATWPLIGHLFRWQYMSPLAWLAINNSLENAFYPARVPENYADDTGLALSIRPPAFLFQSIDSLRLPDYLEVLSSQYALIEKPLLSIAGENDRIAPPEKHHFRLIEDVKHTQAAILKHTGHVPHHTHSLDVMQIIEEFVQDQVTH